MLFPGRVVIAIVVNMDVMLEKRKMKLGELAAAVGVSMANLSILKTGQARAVRFSTLKAICRILECQPSDILEFRADLLPSQDSEDPNRGPL